MESVSRTPSQPWRRSRRRLSPRQAAASFSAAAAEPNCRSHCSQGGSHPRPRARLGARPAEIELELAVTSLSQVASEFQARRVAVMVTVTDTDTVEG